MNSSDESNDRLQRIGRIQTVVQEDYERVTTTDDSYVVLNLKPGTSLEQIRARYERYERFYRPENFHRLGDDNLTARAVEIRAAMSEAMARIQATFSEVHDDDGSGSQQIETLELPTVGDDARALGDIYYRDGLTYLVLGDLNAAVEMLQRSQDYDPTLGVALAHLAYTRYKLRPTDPSVVESTADGLRRAALFNPDNPEVHVLQARFAINTNDLEEAHDAIERLETIDPGHPRLNKLRLRAKLD